MSDDICVRYVVSGKVQGVFFRASAAREARRLGLKGHAVNLADGRVEVLALGPAVAVEELGRWLHHGPPAARVERVEARPEIVTGFRHLTGFCTG